MVQSAKPALRQGPVTLARTSRLVSRRVHARVPHRWVGWLFVLPGLLVVVQFIFLPALQTFYLSLYAWNGVSAVRPFVGLANYQHLLFDDSIFWVALRNNVIWMVCALIVPPSIALFIAVLLNRPLKGRAVFRAIFYFPNTLSSVVVSLVWVWIYHPQLGLLNDVLGAVGLTGLQFAWLGDTRTALYAVFVAAVWGAVGFLLVLFLAGLQSIPQEMYDAARIDGANSAQTFAFVTLPLLSETFIVVVALTIIGSFKLYDIVYAMTQGGPAYQTQVLATWMYWQNYMFTSYGPGSAVAVILVFFVMLITIPYMVFMMRRSHW